MSLRSVGATKPTTTIIVRDPETLQPLKTIGGKDDMTVTLHGPYSTHYKQVLREHQQRRTTEVSLKGSPAMSPEEIDAFSRDLVFQCIESWTVTLEGEEIVPLERDAVYAVFAEFPWLFDALNLALGNLGNFLERPKPR